MRHSRRLTHAPASSQPQGPFCSHCERNLSPQPVYIRCAEPVCENVPICIDCFSVGAADEEPHLPSHPYRVVEKITDPLFAQDWQTNEELRLLEALCEHGPNHWKAVADYVGKTPRKCELHYENVYLNGPNAPFATEYLSERPAASPAPSVDATEEGDAALTDTGLADASLADAGDGQAGAPEGQPKTEPLEIDGRTVKNKVGDVKSGSLEGFMPLRGDFDVEWDDKAEELISDLAIEPTDTEEEQELKTRLLTMYNQRLQRRNAVKDFLFDRHLLEFSALKYADRRGTRDEKELSARLQVFSRLLNKTEFQAFYDSVMTEYRISRDVFKLAQSRKTGMKARSEVDIYEVERKVRCQRLSESLNAKAKSTSTAVEKRKRNSAGNVAPPPENEAEPSKAQAPGTPSSLIVSPGGITHQNDSLPVSSPGDSSMASARRAREKKRIAKSPYPLLESMPVENMEDAWKLSQTEKKLCSALHIPPTEFLRMRDAMLYTATQDTKRRGRKPNVCRPTRGGPFLTLRATRPSNAACLAQTENRIARVTSTPPCTGLLSLSVSDGKIVTATIKGSCVESGLDGTKLSSVPPKDGEHVNSERCTGSGTWTASHETKCERFPGAPQQGQRPNHASEVLRPKEDFPIPGEDNANASVAPSERATQAPIVANADVTGPVNGKACPVSAEQGASTAAGTPRARTSLADTLALLSAAPEVKKRDKEQTVSVFVSTTTRPITRSAAKRSKQLREIVNTHMNGVTRESGSASPDWEAASSTPSRNTLRVVPLDIKRPVTRAYSACKPKMLETPFDSLSVTPTKAVRSLKADSDMDSATDPGTATKAGIRQVGPQERTLEVTVPTDGKDDGKPETVAHSKCDMDVRMKSPRQGSEVLLADLPSDSKVTNGEPPIQAGPTGRSPVITTTTLMDAEPRGDVIAQRDLTVIEGTVRPHKVDEPKELLAQREVDRAREDLGDFGTDGPSENSESAMRNMRHVNCTGDVKRALRRLDAAEREGVSPDESGNGVENHASDADELLDQGRASRDISPLTATERKPRGDALQDRNVPGILTLRLNSTREKPISPGKARGKVGDQVVTRGARTSQDITERGLTEKQLASPTARRSHLALGKGSGRGGSSGADEGMEDVEEVTLDEGKDEDGDAKADSSANQSEPSELSSDSASYLDIRRPQRKGRITSNGEPDAEPEGGRRFASDGQESCRSPDNPTCQTELASEPASPESPCIEPQLAAGDHEAMQKRLTEAAKSPKTPTRNAVTPSRRSSRLQKRSHRLEYSPESPARPAKRARREAPDEGQESPLKAAPTPRRTELEPSKRAGPGRPRRRGRGTRFTTRKSTKTSTPPVTPNRSRQGRRLARSSVKPNRSTGLGTDTSTRVTRSGGDRHNSLRSRRG